MAPRKQVSSLFNCSRQTLASFLSTVCEKFLNDATSVDVFIESIEMLEQSRNILVHSHPKIAKIWLSTADKLVDQWRSSSSDPHNCSSSLLPKIEFAVNSLVSVATQFRLKRITLSKYSGLVQSSFLTYSERMNDLEYLDCSLWKEVECLNQQVFDSLPLLKKLTEFKFSECTDGMIMTLCENCEFLEWVLLDGSSQVTDKSLEYLALLKKLKMLDVNGTQVTEKKLVKFLLTSESDAFEDIIGFDVSLDVNVFLNHLETEVVPFRTFNLQYMWCDDADSNLISLIPKYFPRMRRVWLTTYLENIPDLVFLNSLEYLELAELYITDQVVSPHLEKLLSLQSPMLTELTLYLGNDSGSDVQIDLHSFLKLGLHCQNLESIRIEGCSFSNSFGTTHFMRNPFQKLKNFHMSCSYSVTGIQTVLGYGLNIEKLQVETGSGLSDDFLASVFQVNPLNKLESLYFGATNGNISVQMIKFVTKNCPRITYLYVSPILTEELEEAKTFVIENNFNVELC